MLLRQDQHVEQEGICGPHQRFDQAATPFEELADRLRVLAASPFSVHTRNQRIDGRIRRQLGHKPYQGGFGVQSAVGDAAQDHAGAALADSARHRLKRRFGRPSLLRKIRACSEDVATHDHVVAVAIAFVPMAPAAQPGHTWAGPVPETLGVHYQPVLVALDGCRPLAQLRHRLPPGSEHHGRPEGPGPLQSQVTDATDQHPPTRGQRRPGAAQFARQVVRSGKVLNAIIEHDDVKGSLRKGPFAVDISRVDAGCATAGRAFGRLRLARRVPCDAVVGPARGCEAIRRLGAAPQPENLLGRIQAQPPPGGFLPLARGRVAHELTGESVLPGLRRALRPFLLPGWASRALLSEPRLEFGRTAPGAVYRYQKGMHGRSTETIRKHYGAPVDAWMILDHTLDLGRLQSTPADLHLAVHARQPLQLPVVILPHEITGPIPPRSRRRIQDERPVRQLGIPEVPG